jgi:uncharacterized membrane protein YhaH (DUF805 family)
LSRIGPVTFRNTALILILIGAMFGLLPLVRPDLALVSMVSFVLFYPWLVIWVRRFHDAGKSGKMFLAVLAVWLITGIVANKFIVPIFSGPPPPVDPQAIWASVKLQMQAQALPAAVVSVIIALAFVFVVNEELKSDPAENAYGPPPGP